MTHSYNLLNEATELMNCVPFCSFISPRTLLYAPTLSTHHHPLSLPFFPSFPPLPLCRVLMESNSNDSRDCGHHWWNSSFGYITPYHRSTVLL